MEEVEIPIAFCPNCEDHMPVEVHQVKPGQIDGLEEMEMWVIICPGCNRIINIDQPVDLKYYKSSELHEATGWKFAGHRRSSS